MEDDYDEEFFEDVEDGEIGYAWLLQARGMDLQCGRCGATFRGMPNHGFCDPCADAIEAGFPAD